MKVPARRSIRTFIDRNLKSGYFFSNKKTSGVSVDFRICSLMRQTISPEGKRNFTSQICKGCYSAVVLTIYNNLANKLMKAPKHSDEQLELFEADCKKLRDKFPQLTKLRFYSLSDFSPTDIPYIIAASQYFTVDIISKALSFPNHRQYITQLINVPNVWISLSFNQRFLTSLAGIQQLLQSTEAKNVNLNYTANYTKENLDDPKFDIFSVLHLMNEDKRKAIDMFKKVDGSRLCAIYDEHGAKVSAHGSCDKCQNCHIGYSDFMKGKRAEIPALSVA